MKLTTKDHRDFLKRLQKKYPCPECPPIKLQFIKPGLVTPDGDGANGVVVMSPEQIEISIVKGRHPWLVAKTIAHEYRHIMQVGLMNWPAPVRGTEEHFKRERDADVFGKFEVYSYLKEVKGA